MYKVINVVFLVLMLCLISNVSFSAQWLDENVCPVDGKILYTTIYIDAKPHYFESDKIDCEEFSTLYSPNYCSYRLNIWEDLGDGYYKQFEVDFTCDSMGHVFLSGYKCFYDAGHLICPLINDEDFDIYSEDNKYYYIPKETTTLRMYSK